MWWIKFVSFCLGHLLECVNDKTEDKYSSISLNHQCFLDFSVAQPLFFPDLNLRYTDKSSSPRLHHESSSSSTDAVASLCWIRVVQNFDKSCGKFFAYGKSPTRFDGDHYKQICHECLRTTDLDDAVHFATFYDTHNKIPVYSAYVFEGLMDCTRLNSWYIEPQESLDDDNNAEENMEFETFVDIGELGENQALNKDYYRSGFDRGHLAPVYHANSQECADATFTLTNAAPQNHSFNRVEWRLLEKSIANDLSITCAEYNVYIVTGVVPDYNQTINNRVNVPSHFWTAYCCLDQNNRSAHSGGAIGINDNNGYITPIITVAELETELERLYGTAFTLFQNGPIIRQFFAYMSD
nr:uncharacterized protein LOC767704 isoform X2 [Danio rerio]|eukprot:XP_021326782.1 uncharacterized protein LOC767704 isoform X2 [Danio rerio]